MTKLTSKVQYKNFEPGEFIDIKERDYDETIKLIETFPWEIQREKIVIGLTNPSITIEGRNNDFLKLAVFFNQKYVLHYFNTTQTLFTKSFIHLKDSFEYIINYFLQAEFDITDFKKENTWLQHNLKHFVSQDFNYVVTSKSIRNYLLSTSGMNFCLSIVFLILFLSKGSKPINILGLIMLLFAIFLIGGGLHLLLFFNYYNYVQDKILIMSKGNDIFYFGSVDNPVRYDKRNILRYTTIRSRGSRNQFNGFAIVEIEFNDGTVLKIPNLLIDYQALEQKLFEYPRIDVNKFPFLKL